MKNTKNTQLLQGKLANKIKLKASFVESMSRNNFDMVFRYYATPDENKFIIKPEYSRVSVDEAKQVLYNTSSDKRVDTAKSVYNVQINSKAGKGETKLAATTTPVGLKGKDDNPSAKITITKEIRDSINGRIENVKVEYNQKLKQAELLFTTSKDVTIVDNNNVTNLASMFSAEQRARLVASGLLVENVFENETIYVAK